MDFNAYTLPVSILVHLFTNPFAPYPIFSPTSYFSSNSDASLIPEKISGVKLLTDSGLLARKELRSYCVADLIFFYSLSEFLLMIGILLNEPLIFLILLFLS